MIDFSLNSLFWAVIGIMGGWIVSHLYFRISLRDKEPKVMIRSNNLIAGHAAKFEDLQFHYKKQPVENLTVSKVMFWNGGRQPIKEEDIDPKQPIAIFCNSKYTLLDVKVVARSDDATEFNCALSNDGKSAIISFSYLDYRQGGVIQVVHTGLSSDDIFIRGKVIGVEKIRFSYYPLAESAELRRRDNVKASTQRRIGFIVALVIGLLLLCPGVTISSVWISSPGEIIENARSAEQGFIWTLFMFFSIGPGFLLAGVSLLFFAYKAFRSQPPKGLEVFEN